MDIAENTAAALASKLTQMRALRAGHSCDTTQMLADAQRQTNPVCKSQALLALAAELLLQAEELQAAADRQEAEWMEAARKHGLDV